MRAAPLVLALVVAHGAASQAQQPPPRDPVRPSPAKAAAPPATDAGLEKKLAADPSAENYAALAKAQERSHLYEAAEATWMQAKKAHPTPAMLDQVAGFYNRTGDFEKAIATLEERAALIPGDAAAFHLIGTYYQEKTQKDQALAHQDRWTYVLQGIAAEDRALAIAPDYVEALVYKNILLRLQANLEGDPGQRAALIAEADTLRSRAMELQAAKQPGTVRAGDLAAAGVPPPPPPPPAPGQSTCPVRHVPSVQPGQAPDGQGPVRVGGNIKPPTKVHHVNPVYPADAQMERVQGVVIIEALITTEGAVSEACILRSIPMLDQAALEAVNQWRFTPTLLFGAPVPVIMTVTVNFTLG